MKNKLLLSAIAAAFFFIAACKKENEKENQATATTKVINVGLNENQSYSYTIPPNGDADDVMEISIQSKHFITSKISTDNTRNTLFEYTPALNYSGSDEVHITIKEGDHHEGGNHPHNGGNCQGHNDQSETNYIFKINIVKTVFP